MDKEVINTIKASAAIQPYSQGIGVSEFVFTSGQLPVDPKTGDKTGEIEQSGIEQQAKQAILNFEAVLRAAGSSLADVIKITVFINDMEDFTDDNNVYSECLKNRIPRDHVLEVSRLPKDALVEIEVIAFYKKFRRTEEI